MEEYPREFSPEAEARVETKKINAWKNVEKRSKSLPLDRYEQLISDYIIQVSRVFAVEACNLQMEGKWRARRTRLEAECCPGKLLTELLKDPNKKIGPYHLLAWVQVGTPGRILMMVKDSPKWRPWLEEKLCAAAEHQASNTLTGHHSSATANRKLAPSFEVSEDCGTVRYRGKEYVLTRNQASMMRVLYQAYLDGFPNVEKLKLLAAVNNEESQVKDSWKLSPLWGTLIVSDKRRGRYRLNLPNPARVNQK
jgi:hypothetical protein